MPTAPRPTRSPLFQSCGGISCEAQGGGVCVGVGVNVAPPAERPDVGGKNEAAYVLDLAPEADFAFGGASRAIDRVFDEFLAAFASLYGRWQRDGFAPSPRRVQRLGGPDRPRGDH